MPGIAVRPCRPSDRDSLLTAIADLQAVEHAMHGSRLPGTAALASAYLAFLEARTAAAGGLLAVAEDIASGAFAGFAAGWIERATAVTEAEEWATFGYLSDVYVVPGRRRSGVAGDLIAALEAHLARKGVRLVRVDVLAANAQAAAAYRAYGFEPYETTLEKRLARRRRV